MAVAQIGHELAHRWSTRTHAIVNGDTIELRGPHDPWGMSGATHWPGSVSTPEGQNIVAAEKLTITINDVIAHNGPRVPSYENAAKAHTTAMVAVTLKGRQPSAAMLTQLEGIRTAWIDYWSKVTGGVGTMTTPTSRSR
jgi:hypothetical protein